MIAPQISSGIATLPLHIPRKPKLLDVINGNRCITMIRLAQTSNVQRNELLAAIQSNEATPQVAEKIVKGLRQLTNHRWSEADIDMAVQPSRASCPTPSHREEFSCTGACTGIDDQ